VHCWLSRGSPGAYSDPTPHPHSSRLLFEGGFTANLFSYGNGNWGDDLFLSDFREATVVTLYLLPELNLKLRPQILKMKPGTRVVSHAFNMRDWEPDETISEAFRDAF